MPTKSKKPKSPKSELQKKKLQLRWLKFARHIVAVMPIAIILIWNFDFYTKTTASTISFSIGTIVGFVFFILKIIGRFPKNVKGIIWASIFTVLAWCLKAIITDLPIFVTGWLVGSILSEILTIPIKKIEKETVMQEQAEKTSAEVIKAITSLPAGGGRV